MIKRSIKTKVRTLCGVFALCFIQVSADAAKDSSTTVTTVVKESKKSRWNNVIASTSATHYIGAKNTSAPSTLFTATVGYKYKNGNSLTFTQRLDKAYYIRPGNSELIFYDTLVRYTIDLDEGALGLKYTLTPEFTAPISESSQRNDIYTRPALVLKISKKLTSWYSVSSKISGRYYVNEFKTTKSNETTRKTSPLTRYSLGISLKQIVNPIPRIKPLSLSMNLSWSEYQYEELSLKNTVPELDVDHPPRHRFTFSLGVAYKLNKNFAINGGMVQDTGTGGVERYGDIHINLYDPEDTYFYLGASASI